MDITIDDVRRAVRGEELVPYFQPLIHLRTGRAYGCEVLARWQHPEAGPILPPNFINLAEEDGLIGDLTRQIFQKACAVAGKIPNVGRLAFNISPLQLTDLGLPGALEGWAKQCGFALSRIEVEVTESGLLQDLGRARAILGGLRELGCKLALDDFGTGYSSLAHLQSLPFDQLKIDRSFVAGMTSTRESRKVVAAIIGLGHSLGMETLAEGVESEAQSEMLVWLGCELGQGWLYGRAVPADQLQGVLEMLPQGRAISLTGPGDDWAASSLEALPAQRLAQLQAIYDGAPVGLCFLDTKLRYVSLNQRLAERNGKPVAAHMGRTVAEMLPEQFKQFQPYLKRALAGESVSGVEFIRPGVDGAPEWASLVSYQPAFDEADEVIGISISVVDITEQKRVQEALHESEYVQRHMGELSRQIPWVMDPEGNNLQISSQWVKTVPSVKDRARNLGWLEAVHPDDLVHTWMCMKEALKSGRAIDVEYRIEGIDGEWRWMRSRGSPRFGENGEIKRWYGSVEDIHESKMASLGLQRRDAKIRAALESIPVAIVVGTPPAPADASADQRSTHGASSPGGQAADPEAFALGLVLGGDAQHALKERNRMLQMLDDIHAGNPHGGAAEASPTPEKTDS
jgi:PAS domain S-box-containing protein